MGALIMTHSDDNGLVLPPNLAPIQVVIIPIYSGSDQLQIISLVAKKIKEELSAIGISVKYDDRDNFKPGFKFNDYELKGVPLRIAIGPRDIDNKVVELARRDTMEKKFVPLDGLSQYIQATLDEMHINLFNRALKFRDDHITEVNNYDEFTSTIIKKGGFISAHWDGTFETEEAIKKETKATIRCIPLTENPQKGKCVYSGKPSPQRVLFFQSLLKILLFLLLIYSMLFRLYNNFFSVNLRTEIMARSSIG